jgi:hypothetical protein
MNHVIITEYLKVQMIREGDLPEIFVEVFDREGKVLKSRIAVPTYLLEKEPIRDAFSKGSTMSSAQAREDADMSPTHAPTAFSAAPASSAMSVAPAPECKVFSVTPLPKYEALVVAPENVAPAGPSTPHTDRINGVILLQ